MEKDYQLSKHFKASEFQCHDGSPLPDNFKTTIKDTIEFLEALRVHMNAFINSKVGGDKIEVGLKVVSGHRSLKYNLRIGSTKTSQHVAGTAADIMPSCGYRLFTYAEFYKMFEDVAKTFKNRPYRLGRYNRSQFVHVDCGYGHGGLRWKGN